jgi:general secretion pathway protein K
MWILVLISVMILSWAKEWRTEIKLTSNYRDAQEARRLAEAGVFYALGRLAETRATEASRPPGFAEQPLPAPSWRPDQTPRIIELPGGRVEVRVGDEAGKINLNLSNELTLTNFFLALGMSPDRVRTIVANILEWRKQAGASPLPSAFSSQMTSPAGNPPTSRKSRFDTVEELSWVKGLDNSPLLPRLCDWFTVMALGSNNINVNTAPLEVLQAMGFAPDQALTIIASRQAAPYRQAQELPPRAVDPRITQSQAPFSFRSSPFCTIKATGMVNNKMARHTIKVLARLDPTAETPWSIINWVDDFPG